MRKIIVFENITVDGFFAGPNGELDWAIEDDEVAKNSKEGQEFIDTFLFGRVTYDMMSRFWPTSAGKTANPIFADILNNTSKIVFSKTLTKAEWQNTEIMKEVNKEEILKLKQMPGKNMMIFGSGTLVTELAKLGLIDEYQLMVNPVVLGQGKPLFKDVTEKKNLKLVKAQIFKSGIVLLQYQPGK